MGSISGLKSNLLLFDLCTCNIMDKNHSENDLLLMKHLLINKIAKAYNGKQVSWHYCWGLDNSPLVITS